LIIVSGGFDSALGDFKVLILHIQSYQSLYGSIWRLLITIFYVGSNETVASFLLSAH